MKVTRHIFIQDHRSIVPTQRILVKRSRAGTSRQLTETDSVQGAPPQNSPCTQKMTPTREKKFKTFQFVFPMCFPFIQVTGDRDLTWHSVQLTGKNHATLLKINFKSSFPQNQTL